MEPPAQIAQAKRSPNDERVQLELVRTLLGYLPTAAFGSFIASAFLIAWYWSRVPNWYVISWLFAAILVNVGLLSISIRWRDLDPVQLFARLELLLIARGCAALVWVVGVFAMYANGHADQLWMLIVVWAGLSVSSVPVMSAIPAAVYWFLFPPAVAIIAVMSLMATPTAVIVAALVTAYSVVLFLMTRRHQLAVARGLRAGLAEDASRKTIASQAAEVKQLLDERDKLQNMKDQFVAAASHDLRQPAQAIGLLARNIHESVSDIALRAQTSALMHASDQINDLLNSLLDTARLDMLHERSEPQWTSLQVIFSRLAPSLQVKAVTHGVELTFSQERYSVFSDPLFLERILQNLVTNAIEHSRGDRVTVDFDSNRSDDGDLTLLLVDNGVGLDPTAVAVVEHAGADGPAPSRNSFSVHGMGLLIAARLARMAEHKLTVVTQRDSGTEFRIHFRTWREGGGERTTVETPRTIINGQAFAEPALAAQAARILVIEDNALVRVGLAAVACKAGLDATVVDGVEEALVAITEDGLRPQAILADWHLGDAITAAEIVPELQAVLPEPVPVIVLTGELALGFSEQELSDIFGGVPSRLLTKPIATDALKRALVDLMSAPRATAGVARASSATSPIKLD